MGENVQIKDSFENILQSDQLLATKLYIPKVIPNNISRDRLNEHLSRGLEEKLTLVCAPAGYGKSTLLAQWLAVHLPEKFRKAWISLNESDNEQGHFWRYFIAALEKIHPGIGKNALSLFDLPESPPITSILTIVINEIDKTKNNLLVVLDDYHCINNKSIHDALAFFINHLPSNMHIIISSRFAPPLGLGKLRACRQVNEITIDDLRFTIEETEELFNKSVDIKLTSNAVSTLEAKTEGWAVGVQLAALSLKTFNDPDHFIRSFAGNNIFIIDYLDEEVLQKQPEDIQLFLMKTSILESFNASLCKAVTGVDNTEIILEYLRKQNLFVISLDDKRNWYRYHYLFSGFLNERLRHVLPLTLNKLHCRASSWYEKNGLIKESIEHALIGEDYEQVSRLIEKNTKIMLTYGKIDTIAGWLDKLPEELITSNVRLSLAQAFIFARVTDFFAHAQEVECRLDIALQRLQAVEKLLGLELEIEISNTKENSALDKLLTDIVDLKEGSDYNKKDILGEVFAVYAIISARQNNINETIKFSNLALQFLDSTNFLYTAVNLWLGRAHHLNNNMEEAKAATVKALKISEELNNIYYLVGSMSCLAFIEFSQGNHKVAAKLYRKLIKIANGQTETTLSMAALACMELGWISYEWNNYDVAERHMLEVIELGKEAKDYYIEANGYLALAQMLLEEGNVQEALYVNHKAEELVRSHKLKLIDDRVEVQQAEIYLLNGEYEKVAFWIRTQNIDLNDEFEGAIKFNELMHYCLYAKLLIYQNDVDRAINLLDRLMSVLKKTKCPEHEKWILRFRAFAYYKKGDLTKALKDLLKALRIAEPGKHIRFFLSEGQPMFEMLSQLLKIKNGGVSSTSDLASELNDSLGIYIEELVSYFGEKAKNKTLKAEPEVINNITTSPKQTISKSAASQREAEVLRYVEAGLSNKEIAQKLFISPGTVRRHLENIYDKLEVANRTQAIIRAKELKIL